MGLTRMGQRVERSVRYLCQTPDHLEQVIDDYLCSAGSPVLSAAAFSADGWQRPGGLERPNSFALEREALKAWTGVQRLTLVNNFVAAALAIPTLSADEVQTLKPGTVQSEQVIAVVGPGRGLGVSGLVPDGYGSWIAMPTEGGSVDLVALSRREDAILSHLATLFDHVAFEHVLSEGGLSNIWQALCVLDGDTPEQPTAEEILIRARLGHPRALETIQLFSGWMGTMTSNLALTMGARGGVYLTGSLLGELWDLFDQPLFLQRFAFKGTTSPFLEEIAINRISVANPAMIGLATLF